MRLSFRSVTRLLKGVWRTNGDDFLRDRVGAPSVAGLRGPAESTNSVVAACLGYIVDTMPEAPIQIVKGKGKQTEVLDRHPLTDLLEMPNKSTRYLMSDLVSAISASLALDGNAYVRIRFEGRYSQPSALEYIPHDLVEPFEQYTGSGLSGYRVTGESAPVDPTHMLHFRVGIDSRNTLKGWSRFKSVQLSILTDNEAEVYNRYVLRNLGVLGWVISPKDSKDTIDPKAAMEIGDRFLRQFTGEDRGKPFVASKSVNVEAAGHTPDKLQVREMRRTPEERICAVFRIPPIVAGVGAGLERSTMANTKEQREQAVESCNCPMWRKLAETMTAGFRELGILKPGERIQFDLSEVRSLQEDETKRHERARANFEKGIWMRSESRMYTGMDFTTEDEVYSTDLNLKAAQDAILGQASRDAAARADTAKALFGE